VKQKRHDEAIEYLKTATLSERNLQFREAINNLDYHFIRPDDVFILKGIYLKLKDTALRNKVLGNLMHNEIGLKQFFLDA
jgi:hypothetical protein